MSTSSYGSDLISLGTLKPGVVIDKRYEIIGVLGRGGMGTVYEAEQMRLKKRVALKMLRDDRLHHHEEDSSLRRFLQEAQAACSIKHRNVVDVIDFGDLDDGSTYYVMERLQGQDLSSVLKAEGPIPWPRARWLLQQALSALAAAHAKSITHRDIKPSNIMLLDELDEWGNEWIKVLDFGIAKIQDNDEDSQSLTGSSELLGTASYMAPELVTGYSPDARTDLYAVGIMTYQLLTGTVPFHGVNTFQVLLQHLNDPPLSPRHHQPSIPPDVEAFILRSLAKDPSQRHQSATEMIERLEQIGDDPPRATEPPPPRAGIEQTVPLPATTASSGSHRPPTSQPHAIRPPDTRRFRGTHSTSSTTHRDALIEANPPPSEVSPGASSNTMRILVALAILVSSGAGVIAWLAYTRDHGRATPARSPAPSQPPPTTATVASMDRAASVVPDTIALPSSQTPPGSTGPPEAREQGADTSAEREGAPIDPPARPRVRPATPSAKARCQSYTCQQNKAVQRLKKKAQRQCRSVGAGQTVTFTVMIDARGHVLMPRILSPSVQTPLGQCIKKVVTSTRFPPPPKMSTHRFEFKL